MGGNTLLCWHAERAGFDVVYQAIKALRRRKMDLSLVLYLLQEDGGLPVPETMEGVRVETLMLSVSDPTWHGDLYQLVKEQVLPRLSVLEGSLHINVSPGTPAMHAVWLILQAGGAFPQGTRLWSSQYNPKTKRSRFNEVKFEVTTYLKEIRRARCLEPEQASYEPEARSPARKKAFAQLLRYAQVSGAPLLIVGERGIGKTRLVETFVKAQKKCQKVVTLACGGLDSSLADSLLFGHVKGAFTGAEKTRKGLLAEADNGVLFLDEIQDLPKNVQRKLVRVFQDRQHRYRPLGSDNENSVNVDLVCATNLTIVELQDRLDADLFDRISHLMVEIPPLRECREDLEDDWGRIWNEIRLDEGLPRQAPWSDDFAREVGSHPLRGNMRDLQRLALLIMAWWPESNADSGIRTALDEWQQATIQSSEKEMGFGHGSRRDRTRWFRARLAQWAKEKYGTWAAAAKALECDNKTLRHDLEHRGNASDQ